MRQNAPNALSVFLGLGGDAAVKDGHGNTALHLATSCNHTACAWELLQFRIDVDAENTLVQTALQVASQHGHQEMRMSL